jgi:hypothetical protein
MLCVYTAHVVGRLEGSKSMAKRKKTDVIPLMLRLREELRKRLETAAKAEKRSLNAEITRRLEASLANERPGSAEWVVRQVAEMWERLAKERPADLEDFPPPERDPPESEDPAHGMESIH